MKPMPGELVVDELLPDELLPDELLPDELLPDEEAKRWRNWDPISRWLALQAMIAWAESQSTVRRNTKEACLANQRRLLNQFQR